MIFKREHPSNPSKRFRSVILNPLGIKLSKKVFYKNRQDTVARHHGVKTCLRRKKTIYTSKFNIHYGAHSNKFGCVTHISLARRYKTFVGLVTYSNGAVICLPLFNGAKLNSLIRSWTYINNPKIHSFSTLTVGSSVPIAYLAVTTCFFNIIYNSNSFAWFCRAAGTFCILSRYNIDKSVCIIKLPTSQLKAVPEHTYVMLGRNSNLFPRGIWIGKAGTNIKRGFRPTVRGVAKNPVDHPHGGRTKSNSPERTPWGLVAKYNK